MRADRKESVPDPLETATVVLFGGAAGDAGAPSHPVGSLSDMGSRGWEEQVADGTVPEAESRIWALLAQEPKARVAERRQIMVEIAHLCRDHPDAAARVQARLAADSGKSHLA